VPILKVSHRDPVKRSEGRSIRARLRGCLWKAAERSDFWAAVLRIIRARHKLPDLFLDAVAAVRRGAWRVYYTTRRAVRARAWRRAPVVTSWALQAPRGRSSADERFALSDRPLIHWVKGDGLDDDVTRSAIAQATRLFGDAVDYCLAINNIDMARARRVVEWATQPVHIWRQAPEDNLPLAHALDLAGCPPERFGYWWKWFPSRIRPRAPEWVLDGDEVVVGKPSWFDVWAAGLDVVRVSQDDVSEPARIHGQYARRVDRHQKLYSGLLSLPPDFDFFGAMLTLLTAEPLVPPHDGRWDMSEQGCFAAAFNGVSVEPIPLHEFPFARAWDADLDFGMAGRRGAPWGYHFGGAFKRANLHYARLVRSGEIFSRTDEPSGVERVTWLRNFGQWGREGWSMHPAHVTHVDACSREFRGRRVLELGTSRGQLAALMAGHGCRVTTVDHEDRGARLNLEGLDVTVEIADGAEYLSRNPEPFCLVVVDLHGNDEATWRQLWPLLSGHVAPGGQMLLYNSHLWRIPEWRAETGLRWVMDSQLADWSVEVRDEPPPGMLICRRP
jgi:hypothetical protein